MASPGSWRIGHVDVPIASSRMRRRRDRAEMVLSRLDAAERQQYAVPRHPRGGPGVLQEVPGLVRVVCGRVRIIGRADANMVRTGPAMERDRCVRDRGRWRER